MLAFSNFNQDELVKTSEDTEVESIYSSATDNLSDSFDAPITKTCPICKEIVRKHVKTCSDCGFEFPVLSQLSEETDDIVITKRFNISILLQQYENLSKEEQAKYTHPLEVCEWLSEKRKKRVQHGRVLKLLSEMREKRKELLQASLVQARVAQLSDDLSKEERLIQTKRIKQEVRNELQAQAFEDYKRFKKRGSYEKRQQRKQKRQERAQQRIEKKFKRYIEKRTEREQRKKEIEQKRITVRNDLNIFNKHRRDHLSLHVEDISNTNIMDGCEVQTYQKNQKTYRIFVGRDGRTYKQQQNKRVPDLWNSAFELYSGISFDEARQMGSRDLSVFPLAYGTNKPLSFTRSRNTYGVRNASANINKIFDMFHFRECDNLSSYNIGIACGNITVLDFDNFWSYNTQSYLRAIKRILGNFDEAVVAFTPGGEHSPGVHLILRKYDNIKSSTIIPGVLDIKNDAHSYICGAGSVRERGVYEWLDAKWIEKHGEEKYKEVLEVLPVKNIIPFDELRSVGELAPLSKLQQKGLQYIKSCHFTGDYSEDKQFLRRIVETPKDIQDGWSLESCLDGNEWHRLKRIADTQETKRYITRNEILGKLPEDQNPVQTKIISHILSDNKQPDFIKRSKSSEISQPVDQLSDQSIDNSIDKSTREPVPKLKVSTEIDKTVQELFEMSRAASYDKTKKVWLSPDANRAGIHPGWKPIYLSVTESCEDDVDQYYLLWKTIVDKIPVGRRNLTLTSFAGVLCRESQKLPSFGEFQNTMLLYNSSLKVPLPTKEVEKICKSIYSRSLKKRGNDPNVVFKSKTKIKNKDKSEHEQTLNDKLTKQKRIQDWTFKNIKENHKRDLCFRAIAIITTGEWDLHAAEDDYFDLTEFKRTVIGKDTIDHSDGQTILCFLRALSKNGLFDGPLHEFKSKRKKIFYDDGSMEVHSVITGITFTYDAAKALQKINNVPKTKQVTDFYNPCCGVLRWFNNINNSGSFIQHNSNSNSNNSSNNSNVDNDNDNKGKNIRQCLCVSKEYIRERSFNSFIMYLENKFVCNFYEMYLETLSKVQLYCENIITSNVA
jgi:hypothetical protein